MMPLANVSSGECTARACHILGTRSIRLRGHPQRVPRKHAQQLRAQKDQNDDVSTGDSTESLFMRELKRRGISADQRASSEDEPASSTGADPAPSFRRSAWNSSQSSQTPQLDRSRQLNSEGLEGLIPRAKELIKLGGSFFLAFAPGIIVISLLFTVLYSVFGDSFVHGGDPRMPPPQYLDPAELLGEAPVDPFVPLR